MNVSTKQLQDLIKKKDDRIARLLDDLRKNREIGGKENKIAVDEKVFQEDLERGNFEEDKIKTLEAKKITEKLRELQSSYWADF